MKLHRRHFLVKKQDERRLNSAADSAGVTMFGLPETNLSMATRRFLEKNRLVEQMEREGSRREEEEEDDFDKLLRQPKLQ